MILRIQYVGCSFIFLFVILNSSYSQETQRDSLMRIKDSTLIYEMDSISAVADSNMAILVDSSQVKKGIAKFLFPGKRPPFDASVAWKRSLIFPGWGQFYNKDYWKLPLVYGAYAGGYLVFLYNDDRYQEYRQGYIERIDDDDTNDFDTFGEFASTEGIKRARDRFRQFRDRSLLAIAGIHILQVIEAYVDAHLNGFDVSDNLSLEINPNVGTPGLSSHSIQPGITMVWTID